jgi:hypothetical protein
LTQRGGTIRPGIDGRSWLVYFDGQPQYQVSPVPVTGKFGSQVMQTINGRRVETRGTFANAEEAVRGGLEDLRKALGW